MLAPCALLLTEWRGRLHRLGSEEAPLTARDAFVYALDLLEINGRRNRGR